MANQNELQVVESSKTAIDIIQSVDESALNRSLKSIERFQNLVRSQFKQDHDFGIIPGTKKPTLLKPGAEKIVMLMGLTSEYDIIESTRDFEKGFFQYQIKCRLLHGGQTITEGMGSANTKESKYIKGDAYTADNTVLKMAKKRALVDAALLVGSLSDIFTQDIEDMDLNGESTNQKRYYTDQDGFISMAQAKRLYAIAKGDDAILKSLIGAFGYKESKEIKKTDYQKISNELEKVMNNMDKTNGDGDLA